MSQNPEIENEEKDHAEVEDKDDDPVKVGNVEPRNYYSTQEVAAIFRVSPKTVARWDQDHKFEEHGVIVRHSPGGHRRFMRDEIHELFQKMLRGELYPEGTPNDDA